MKRPLALWLALFPPGALISGALWRAEIEWHGWAGLLWLSYFHWAVPFGLALHVASAVVVARASRGLGGLRLALLGGLLAGLAVFGYLASTVAAATLSRSWMWMGAGLGDAPLRLVLWTWGPWVVLALLPWLLGALLAAQRLWPGLARLLAGWVLWLTALPLTSWLDRVSEVEAIKRGWPVPLLYLALAILFLPRPLGAGTDGARPTDRARPSPEP